MGGRSTLPRQTLAECGAKNSNMAIFLISVTSIIIAVPFVDRNDWPGWVASFVTVVAALTVVGQRLSMLYRTIKEWRDGEVE